MNQACQTHKSKSRLLLVTVLVVLGVVAATGWTCDAAASAEVQFLARVEAPGSLADLNLPVYADMVDGAGKYYTLVIAAQAQLQGAGVAFLVIDACSPGTRYLIALERRPGARLQASKEMKVLYDDGRRIIVKDSPGLADALAEMGFALKLMSDTPMILAPSVQAPQVERLLEPAFTPDLRVSQMIGQVTQEGINSFLAGLSGETPVTVEGAPYTLTTRHTSSGTPLQKATQYVFEQLQTWGLSVSFHTWTGTPWAGRNVVGELRGFRLPDEIVLVTAHLDDMPSSGAAPGADDNGSGSAALLAAAQIMSRYQFQRTIRFVFFTGEEQGLYGSASYAGSVAAQKIIAVLNLDMIAYSTQTAPIQRLHTRTSANPGFAGDLAIANTLVNVVNTYGLAGSLQPTITSDGENASDHSSFWDKGFPAVLAIEDDKNNFNPRYHTSSDQLQYLNMPYCTAQVKATVGTTAHLAAPFAKVTPAPWLELLLLSWQKLPQFPDDLHNFSVN